MNDTTIAIRIYCVSSRMGHQIKTNNNHGFRMEQAIEESDTDKMLANYEAEAIHLLYSDIRMYRVANGLKDKYYHSTINVRDFGISIPPALRGTREAVGWIKTAVDAVQKRILFEGWDDPFALGLNDFFDANHLLTESRKGHLDALKFGVSYIVVSAGDVKAGEPPVLITVENPNFVNANYSVRKRRVEDAIIVHDDKRRKVIVGTYLTEYEKIPFIIKDGNIYDDPEEERSFHGFGRVPVVQITNRTETGSNHGHSEITESLMSVTDNMMRTLLGAEVAREFYSAPQRYILGADESMFIDADGNSRDALSVLMDRVLILPEGMTEGQNPTVGQFQANSPSVFIQYMEAYAKLFSQYSELPDWMFNFNTANPTSADAIKASESSLIKKAQDRIDEFMKPWAEVARLAIIASGQEIPEGFKATPMFRNPATISSSAAADEVIKLTGGGAVLRPDSSEVYRILGFSRAQIENIRAENSAITATNLIESLRAKADPTAPTGLNEGA